MEKNNIVISGKAKTALKKRTETEIKLLALLGECESELLGEFIDAWTEYEDCLLKDNIAC